MFQIVDLKNFSWCNVIQQIKKTSPDAKNLYKYSVFHSVTFVREDN